MVVATFLFEHGLGEATELSKIRDPITRVQAGAEIQCHETTIWLFTHTMGWEVRTMRLGVCAVCDTVCVYVIQVRAT